MKESNMRKKHNQLKKLKLNIISINFGQGKDVSFKTI